MKVFQLIAAGLCLALSSTAQAQDKPELTIYTYDSFVSDWGPGPAVEKAFEETCECDLNLVAAGDGAALLSRILLEGERTKADIVLGLDTNLTARATKTGLFAPYNKPPTYLDVPIPWEDKIFLPYDWGYFAFVYDNTKLTDVPDSFESLINAPDDLKIVIQDPRSSTPGLGLLLWVKTAYGDRAPEIWEKLTPKILTVTKGWSEAYGMFTEGEADMVLSYTTSPAYHIIAEDDHTKSAAAFKEGHYMQIEVAGKLASSDQQELADDFLKFMTSPKFQDIIPTTNWMYPAVFPYAGLPKGFETLITPTESLIVDPVDAEKTRDAALAEWLTALSQ
ncbi:UNVERIFIED_CONTAM: hypothetical protein GTU68_062782 [Idotea baltica]|nr:hypothetical protein [Idotea baltica]